MMFTEQPVEDWKQKGSADQWWAWSASHGWVVLDRSYPANRLSLLPEGYRFVRCRDWTVYEQGDQPWNYEGVKRRFQYLEHNEAEKLSKELDALEEEWLIRRLELLRS